MEREEALAEQIKDLKAKMILVEKSLVCIKNTLCILSDDFEDRTEFNNRMETSYHG